MMSYIPHIFSLLMVLSPLSIPTGARVVRAFATGRPTCLCGCPRRSPDRVDRSKSPSNSIEEDFACSGLPSELLDHRGLFGCVGDDFDVAAVVNV